MTGAILPAQIMEGNMGNMHTKLSLIQGLDIVEPASQQKQSGISQITLSIMLAVAISAAAAVFTVTGGKPAAESGAMVQQAAAGQTDAKAAEEFEYFPSRYVNQATEIEEHIQAF